MRVELIANEASGGGTDVDALRAALERHGATVSDHDVERVVVAGGDGTVAEGATRAAELEVPLGVIAAGTANDFARAHDLPRGDLDAAAKLAVTGTETVRVELGAIDGRPFVNVASTGLAPAAARRATPFKRVLGPAAYSVGALAAGAMERPVACEIGDVFSGKAWQVTVACTGAFGGGSEIEAANPHDGRLDLVVVPAGRRIGLARSALAMRRGTIAEQPGVIHTRSDEFTLRVPPETLFNVDGELVRAGPDVRLTICDSFDVVVG